MPKNKNSNKCKYIMFKMNSSNTQKYTQRGSTNSEMNLALTLYLRKLTEWPIVIEHNRNIIIITHTHTFTCMYYIYNLYIYQTNMCVYM